jgi:hypothetical protein
MLEKQVADQTNWQTNMLLLAGRVSQGTLDELSKMGPEGAPLVADLVNASDAELAKFDDVTAKRSKEAMDAWGAQLTMAQPVLAAVARKGRAGRVDSPLAHCRRHDDPRPDRRAVGHRSAGGINPILSGLGKPRIHTSGWDATGFMGPVQLKNADGNLYENHQAEIAPVGRGVCGPSRRPAARRTSPFPRRSAPGRRHLAGDRAAAGAVRGRRLRQRRRRAEASLHGAVPVAVLDRR